MHAAWRLRACSAVASRATARMTAESCSRRALCRAPSATEQLPPPAAAACASRDARARTAPSRTRRLAVARLRPCRGQPQAAFACRAAGAATTEAPSPASDLAGEMTWPQRDTGCGAPREAHVGQRVTLCGWIDKQRNMGAVVFADLRDHTGIVQVVSAPDTAAHAALERVRQEYVVLVTGTVRARSAPNTKIPTGGVEVLAESVTVLNVVSRSLPFAVNGTDVASEEVRLRYRALDLRRPALAENLRLRHRVVKALRRVLEDKHDFLEVETPQLTRSTPEGARDFLVPSRRMSGFCYALPQSPQLFKQLLMVSGFDRYYQIARCFRDEDLRADRQPEFTQLDIEMAFTPMEGIITLGEELMVAAFEAGLNVTLPRPFPRMTYAEAMERYGCDKPDTRYGLELRDVSSVVADSGFRLFTDAVAAGGVVKAIAVPDGGRIANSALKPKGDVHEAAISAGAGGLLFARLKITADGAVTIDAPKAVKEALTGREQQLVQACHASDGDLLLFAAGTRDVVSKTLDKVRQFVAEQLGMVPEGKHNVLWVTDFPMFGFNEEEQRLEAMHHPFTAPNGDDMRAGDLTTARANAYDCVYNGVEVGGGSLRIYRRDIQAKVFKAIGLSDEEAQEKFGWLLEVFELGAPPHAGIAFGLDRLIMLIAGAKSIRDVIAFPKTAAGMCLLTGAPGRVTTQQLAEVHLKATGDTE